LADATRPGSRAKQRDATRARLLKVARRVFSERGYDGVAVGELCKKAKVTHGALYHHFPEGKPELFAAVVAEVFAELSGRVSAAVAEHEGWPAVKAACDAYLDACADPAVQTIIFRDGPRVLASAFEGADREASEPLVTSLLRQWMAEGLLRPRPVVTLARLLGSLFQEAGALIATATDPAHTRAQVDALLSDWFAVLRRSPGALPHVLATDRLVLEPWSLEDTPMLTTLLARHELRRYAFDTATSERRFSQGGLGLFLARDGQQRLIGAVGFAGVADPENDEKAEELVVVVDPAFLRKGYGYELAEVVLREASARGISPVRASAEQGNVAALRLIERLGFVRWAWRAGVVEYVHARVGMPRAIKLARV
jgi:AcrR family transcriptional regulator